ncbi:MAG: YbhB/YbcL family Raf kinase inhibitor-like protein [Methanomicrobiaceae archaeon]|nr:YbhB/YbcL family Raf kinase inhibitor-like protein [Methanomicrobiaceae archaeon]MDD5419376.1 YbhB/YbcL family Raf kinase inhibitor-like protein [Methanomicrobiaceae archaeon]
MNAGVGRLSVQLRSAELPIRSTCYGGDISPEIRIGRLNPAVQSIAVFALNPFEPGCSHTAWIIWNIEPRATIPEGIPKEGRVTHPLSALQGINDAGSIGYRGPCPRSGEMHRYLFKVYGLDAMLDLPPGAAKHQVIGAMKGHVLQFGDTIAIYG